MLSEIAKSYLQHGCIGVALFARSQEKLEKVCKEVSPEGKCIPIIGDVRNFESCSNAVKTIIEKFGRLDILMNGAAGNFLASAEKLSTNGFKTVMEIDTLGTFNMSRAAF